MNKLTELCRIIDPYVEGRNASGDPLEGKELQDYSWIVTKLAEAATLQREGKMIRFNFLYGKLRAAAEAFIRRYVPSEPRR